MATKGKGKILDGQIAFEFFGELNEDIKPIKKKAIEPKHTKQIKEKKIYRKKNLNVKANHLKKNRKIRKSKRR